MLFETRKSEGHSDRATGWTVRGSNADRDKRFFSSPISPDPPSPPFNGYRGSLPAVKQQGREINHWSPSSAEVKKKWSYTSPPSWRRQRKFHFYFKLRCKKLKGLKCSIWQYTWGFRRLAQLKFELSHITHHTIKTQKGVQSSTHY